MPRCPPPPNPAPLPMSPSGSYPEPRGPGDPSPSRPTQWSLRGPHRSSGPARRRPPQPLGQRGASSEAGPAAALLAGGPVPTEARPRACGAPKGLRARGPAAAIYEGEANERQMEAGRRSAPQPPVGARARVLRGSAAAPGARGGRSRWDARPPRARGLSPPPPAPLAGRPLGPRAAAEPARIQRPEGPRHARHHSKHRS